MSGTKWLLCNYGAIKVTTFPCLLPPSLPGGFESEVRVLKSWPRGRLISNFQRERKRERETPAPHLAQSEANISAHTFPFCFMQSLFFFLFRLPPVSSSNRSSTNLLNSSSLLTRTKRRIRDRRSFEKKMSPSNQRDP